MVEVEDVSAAQLERLVNGMGRSIRVADPAEAAVLRRHEALSAVGRALRGLYFQEVSDEVPPPPPLPLPLARWFWTLSALRSERTGEQGLPPLSIFANPIMAMEKKIIKNLGDASFQDLEMSVTERKPPSIICTLS